MKIPKWFKKWFGLYGTQNDMSIRGCSFYSAQRIAWRAYRKGKKDGQKLNQK